MASTSQTAIDAHGYCFQLPPLGLPDSGPKWIPLRAAVGPKEACDEQLLMRHNATPIREYHHICNSFELEYDGWIWKLPLLPSRVSPQEADIFTVMANRVTKSSVPARQRPSVPDGAFAIFILSSLEEIDCQMGPVGDSDPSYMETSEVLRLCRDPHPTQCQPSPEQRKQWMLSGVDDIAHKAWPALSYSFVSEDWHREVKRQAIAAGLQKANDGCTETLYVLRPCEEPDQEGRGLEYALRSPDDYSDRRPEDWRPVPAWAFPPDYVRCGVNLRRLVARKKLLTKEEWPIKGAVAASQGGGGM